MRGDSKIENEKIAVSLEDYTKPEEAKKFAEETKINRLAIAVGNIHGISLEEPALDIERIRQIQTLVSEDIALVLHAGSGIPDEQIKSAINAGIANIHINTDIRVAFVGGLKKALEIQPNEVAMYKLDKAGIDAMKEVIKAKLRLFGAVDRI